MQSRKRCWDGAADVEIVNKKTRSDSFQEGFSFDHPYGSTPARSRKRHSDALVESDRTPKKSRGYSSQLQHPIDTGTYEISTLNDGTKSNDHPSETRYCTHKMLISCSLTMPICCSCADRRPWAPTWTRYVDGLGDVETGDRWQHYCHGCYGT